MTAAPAPSAVRALDPPGTAPATTVDLSVIIVSWNTRDLLRACLRSVLDNLGPLAAEVIVVDNASADGSAAMVAAEFPGVALIASPENHGFAGGNNRALRIARGRHLLLLNPDTVVFGDVLPRAVAYAEDHPDVGVLGCQVMQGPDEIQPTCFRFPSPLHTLLFAVGLSHAWPDSPLASRATYGGWARDVARDVDVVSGMFMLVPRAAYDDVGPMDESYFVYAEETDWCWRFRKAGWRCVFAPVGRILHVDGGGKSTEQVSVPMYVELQKNLVRFQRRRRGRAAAAVSKALFVVAMLVRLAAFGPRAALGGDHGARQRVRQAVAALRFHVTGVGPGR